MFYFLILICVNWIIIIIIIIIANYINLHVYLSHFHLCVWNIIIIVIIMLCCVCNWPCWF
jgi:hypothetical protein